MYAASASSSKHCCARRGDLDFDPAVALGPDQGYITPKVDVRGAAFLDGRVLMVRSAPMASGRCPVAGAT